MEGEWYQLSGTKDVPGSQPAGSFVAVDPATGGVRWRFEMLRNPSGGALATAGGLVFIGDSNGNLIGFDGKTGKVLWRFQTGATISAPPVSYTFEGKQYIALASGTAVLAFTLPDTVK